MDYNLYPKDILETEFSPGRRLAHFLILLRNMPGSLEDAAVIARENHVNILNGFHNAPSASKEGGLWSFFADFTETKMSPPEFAAKLKALPSVSEVEFHESNNGFLVDLFHFPPTVGGVPSIIVRRETLSKLLDRVREILGPGPVAKVLLAEMGISAGKFAYQGLKATLGEGIVKEQFEQLTSLYTAAGWGVAKILEINYESKHAVIRLSQNFECQPHKGNGNEAYSHFVRGDLAGWFGEVFRTRIECTERRCVAKGDEFCEFSIEPLK